MADGTIGNAAIDRAYYNTQGLTNIIYQNAASKTGKLYKVEFFAYEVAATKNAKIKVFREVGANFVQVGSDYAIAAGAEGLNTITLVTPIDVQVGDYIAWWTHGTNRIILDAASSGGSEYIYSGDVTGTLAKASWTARDYIPSLYGYILPRVSGGLGIGNPWIFMKDMWEKHNKLWTPKGLMLPKDLEYSY